MNISCEIIRDLLPLYQQSKCCSQSTALVEEHLKHCSKCKKEFEYNLDKGTKNSNTMQIEKKSATEYRTKLLGAGGIGFALAFVVFYLLPLLL